MAPIVAEPRTPWRAKAVMFVVLGLIAAIGATLDARPNGAQGAATQVEDESATLASFEVASIKPLDPKAERMVGVNVYTGGRVVLSGLSLKAMICVAFNLSYWQVSGGDSWTDKVAYNLEALPSERFRSTMPNTRHTLFGIEDEHLRAMLQILLIDRFSLRFHRETRSGKVYFLERNGKTLRLHPTKATSAGSEPSANNGASIGFAEEWVLYKTTMPQLAKFASDYVLHRPVMDRTELLGSFVITDPRRRIGIHTNKTPPAHS